MEGLDNPVYSKNVVEFVTVANEYCLFIENASGLEVQDFIDKAHKVVAFLYLKATLLPVLDSEFEEFNEKYVTEEDYNFILNMVARKLGKYNDYEEVFDPLRDSHDEPAFNTLSENFADIYQDLKNFVLLYQVGTHEVMYEAIWDVQQNFEQYWGQKLVNGLRALHHLKYTERISEERLERENKKGAEDCDVDTSDWFISKAQEDFKDE
ncbi:MAG: DUF5063 domain-containing protein [Bacteroidales bacterium]|nr:DUF5063 domain-containing protein [Bacteroidales bacterium]